VFASFGVSLAREEYQKCVGGPPGFWDVVIHLGELTGRNHDDAEMRARQWAIYGVTRQNLRPRPGIPELLAQLQARSIPFGIASNSTLTWVEEHLEIIGLRDLFKVIVTRDQVPHPKPAPDSYLEACRRLHAAPQFSIAVEDSPFGATAAKAAGMLCVAWPSAMTLGRDFGHADLVLDEIGWPAFERLIETA
jgi:HAD superfamily hydrolase (TIGR01509 family)